MWLSTAVVAIVPPAATQVANPQSDMAQKAAVDALERFSDSAFVAQYQTLYKSMALLAK